MTEAKARSLSRGPTRWDPDVDLDGLLLAEILKRNPLPIIYRISYVANFFIGPLVRLMEENYGLTRSEWIVLFCLQQQAGLNAQLISNVTGRPKTSISTAVNQLQRKKLIVRHADVKDGRRQVLQSTAHGAKVYADILQHFKERESNMLSCLPQRDRQSLMRLLNIVIANNREWAQAYG